MTCGRADTWPRLVLDPPHDVLPLSLPEEEEEATIDGNTGAYTDGLTGSGASSLGDAGLLANCGDAWKVVWPAQRAYISYTLLVLFL